MNQKMYKIAIGEDWGGVKTVDVDWVTLVKQLSTHKQANRKGGQYFVGGYFNSERRKEENLVARTVITLDCDDVGVPLDELELELTMGIDCAFVAYSTFSHKKNSPRIRIVIPLEREITPLQYRQVAKQYGESLGLNLDPCSYTPNQAMDMPTCVDLGEAWAIHQDGEPLSVEPHMVAAADVDDDLDELLKAQPLDLTDTEVINYLKAYPSDGKEYDEWFSVGSALHHQYCGDDKGYKLWLKWSERSDKHDPKLMRKKWASMGNSTRVTTFATVIYHAKEGGGIDAAGDQFEELLVEASNVDSLEAYGEYKTKITSLPDNLLATDQRSMIAAELAQAFGKEVGLTKTDIKKVLAPSKRDKRGGDNGQEVPDWMGEWVYVESTCDFANIDKHYAIKREAFNAKYDREPECLMAETYASRFALVDCKIDTVVDTMYWPGAAQFFDYEQKTMLNSYIERGVEPCDVLDDDGQSVVDVLLKHIDLTLDCEREKTILLDWLSYCVQHAGQRINWALLLQGTQGTGKTFFGNVLQMVLGDNVKNLDPMSIAGRFTGWGHGSVVTIVEEIRISGANRYEVLDRMKPFLTNDTIQIEEKGRDHRTVPNFTNYLMLTNHKDAIPLVSGDRRYCVLFSRIQSEKQLYAELGGESGADAYFDRLFSECKRRPDALAHFLRNRKISKEFTPRGRAPHTNARQQMMELSVSPDREIIENAIDQHKCAVINEDVLDVTWLNALCEGEGEQLPKTRTMSAILLEMGYNQIEGRKVKVAKTGKNHIVWVTGVPPVDDVKAIVRDFHCDPDFIPF